MYQIECRKKLTSGACVDKRCVFPDLCPVLKIDHSPQVELLKKIRQIPGIRKWPAEYMPTIFDAKRVDELRYVNQKNAENMTRKLATEEGIFAGISSGGGLYTALQLSREVENAVIVSIVCDRGDRYLSTGVFPS
jgi:cysteine synthase